MSSLKVLFICKSNAERSQAAECVFNSLSKVKAKSAGTDVGLERSQGFAPGSLAIRVMNDLGYDMSHQKRKQLTYNMVKKADLVVVFLKKEEQKYLLPDYVKKSNKVVYKPIWWSARRPDGSLKSEEELYHIFKEKFQEIEIFVKDLYYKRNKITIGTKVKK